MAQKDILRIYFVVFGAFFVFSSIFNYMPFYLSGPYFRAPTKLITLMYLSYIVGIIMGPLAGKLGWLAAFLFVACAVQVVRNRQSTMLLAHLIQRYRVTIWTMILSSL